MAAGDTRLAAGLRVDAVKGAILHSEFDPAADWFFLPAAEASTGDVESEAQRQAAAGVRALNGRLAAASRMHDAAEWLAGTAAGPRGAGLRDDMIAAVIAADHYRARVACPRRAGRRLRGKAWQAYAERRAASALARFGDVLLRWTVLERIPANWIEPAPVLAQIAARLASEGFTGIEVRGRFVAPFAGGAEWVRGECAPEIRMAGNGGIGDVRAAVVLWKDRVEAVVLTSRGGVVMAHGPRLAQGGLKLQWDGPEAAVGLALLPSPETPPCGWFVAFCRALRAGGWLWEWDRRWRRRRQGR